MVWRMWVVMFFVFGLAVSSQAVEPEEVLSDPALEIRAREISKQLRCLVCQNENIDSSNAQLAKDLRVLVRERLVAGDSDEEVVAFVVDRYGDFVLLRPPVQTNTLPLWLAPFFLLSMAAAAFYMNMRRQSEASNEKGLTSEESARLKDILDE